MAHIKSNSFLVALALCGALVLPSTALAGKGASYQSISNALATGNRDSIVAELERAEKLPCAPCIDLVRPLVDHDDAAVRDVAAWWLSKRAIRDQVRDEMFARLTAGNSVAARNAAEVLGRFKHPDALMPLELAIHDGALSDEARVAATNAVGTIGDFRGKALLEGAITSESAPVRAAAAKALRGIRGNADGIAVVELLGDDDEQVVREAAVTVGVLRETGALAELARVVTDASLSAVVRKEAAWALGNIRDGSVRDVLKRVAAEDPSMLVRGTARAALANLR